MQKIFILVALVILSGCASEQAYKEYSTSTTSIATAYYKAAERPLLDLKLPAPEGKEYHLVVNREVKQVDIQQIKDSEWTGPVQSLISAAGLVGGAAVVSSGAGSRTETVGGDRVSGDSMKPITTTTTTTTEVVP